MCHCNFVIVIKYLKKHFVEFHFEPTPEVVRIALYDLNKWGKGRNTGSHVDLRMGG